MKKIKFTIVNRANLGTEEEPNVAENFFERTIPYSEANYAIAKAEAYNGEVEVIEAPDPETPEPSTAEPVTWDELDNAYTEGYKEGVNNAYGG